jgi:hypothetical protein
MVRKKIYFLRERKNKADTHFLPGAKTNTNLFRIPAKKAGLSQL